MIRTSNTDNPNEIRFQLNKEDVESAIRQFICSCNNDVAIAHVIDVNISGISPNIFVAYGTAKLQK